MEEKRVILFLVEGETDEASLAPILRRISSNPKIFFHIVNTDITSDRENNCNNILLKLEQEVKKECKILGFFLTDILQIVHLIDTDGAFVGDEAVVLGESESVFYTEAQILTRYVEPMKQRNRRKSAILRLLTKQTALCEIPYQIYYFSCNLEHVLHNEQNVLEMQKRDYAARFADLFYDYPTDFISFIKDPLFAVAGDYQSTWDFIMKANHSLLRYTNFHLFF